MKSNFYILSTREVDNSPANFCAIEFEDVIVKCLDARIINIKNPHDLKNLRKNGDSANRARSDFVEGQVDDILSTC